MSAELPPPYTALTKHPMLARTNHDESARFNFLTHLNRYLSGTLGPGNKLAYEKRVLPAFRAEHGRDPEHRYEIRDWMNQDPFHRMWSALKRNSMEMRQQNGRSTVLRQLDELDAQARQFNEHSGQLELDPKIQQPIYQTAVDIHCQPGGYHGEERPGDVSAGANYDVGIFATTGGALGGLNDGGGQAVVNWIKKERPEWQPRRILDVGCTVGHNAVPIAAAAVLSTGLLAFGWRLLHFLLNFCSFLRVAQVVEIEFAVCAFHHIDLHTSGLHGVHHNFGTQQWQKGQ